MPGRSPALLLLLAACADANPIEALRNLGDDCLSCHRTEGKAAKALFTVGGTIYRTRIEEATAGLGGTRVLLVGADGRRLELRANEKGNFWSREPVAFPVAVEVWRDGVEARRTVPAGPCRAGSCNDCHTLPPKNGARGRISAPAR